MWLKRVKERNYPVKLDLAGVAYVTVPWGNNLRMCDDKFINFNSYYYSLIFCQENTSNKTITVSFRFQRTPGNEIYNNIERLVEIDRNLIVLFFGNPPELSRKYCTTHMYYTDSSGIKTRFDNMGYAYIETNTAPNYLAMHWINSPASNYQDLSRDPYSYINILIDCTFMYTDII
jgi:hypothetical protein